MVRGRLAVGALLASVAVTSPALAAPKAPVDKFSVTASVRVEHQSNMSGVSEAESKLRGVSPADTTYAPGIGVVVNLPVGRQTFFLNGYAGYLYHDKNSIYDSERLTLDTGVRGRIAICDVVASGNYQRALSSFEDIVLGPTVDNILEVKGARLQVGCARRTGLGVTGSVSREVAENDRLLLRSQDYTLTSYMGGVTYSKPRLGTLTLFGQHQETEYDHRVPIAGQGDGYKSNAAGLTYERHLGARIDGSVTVSYTSVSGTGVSAPGVRTDFDGFTYQLTGAYRASQRLRFDGSFGRNVTPSNRFGNTYDVTTNYAVHANYELGSRISTSIGYSQNETDSTGGQIFAGNLTDSTVKIVSGSVQFKLNRRIGLSLDAAHEQRDANNPRYTYDNTRVGVTASATY